jgi:hypothetical protein
MWLSQLVNILLLLQSRFQDQMLGKLQIPVADVARNGYLKDPTLKPPPISHSSVSHSLCFACVLLALLD